MPETTHHRVLIVGGGTAGMTVAASLRRHGPGAVDIAIVEPSDIHYYQPALTLVGAGVYDLARICRPTVHTFTQRFGFRTMEEIGRAHV